MFGAFHPGHAAVENGFELTGVQMSPAALRRMVVNRRREAADRADKFATYMANLHFDLFRFNVQIHVRHLPVG